MTGIGWVFFHLLHDQHRTDFLRVWRSFGCTLGLVCTASSAFCHILFWDWVCLVCFVGCFFVCVCLKLYLVSSSFFTVLLQNFHCGRDILVYSNTVCSLSLYCVCSSGWQLMAQNRKILLLDAVC